MTKRVTAEERFALHDLLMAYVWASDTANAAAYAATFAEGGVLVASDGGRVLGRAAIEAHAYQQFAAPGQRGRMHFFQQIRCEREGDAIRIHSFWQVVQMAAPMRSGRVRSTGTCEDLCIPAGKDFLFAERRIFRWNDETAPWSNAASPG